MYSVVSQTLVLGAEIPGNVQGRADVSFLHKQQAISFVSQLRTASAQTKTCIIPETLTKSRDSVHSDPFFSIVTGNLSIQLDISELDSECLVSEDSLFRLVREQLCSLEAVGDSILFYIDDETLVLGLTKPVSESIGSKDFRCIFIIKGRSVRFSARVSTRQHEGLLSTPKGPIELVVCKIMDIQTEDIRLLYERAHGTVYN